MIFDASEDLASGTRRFFAQHIVFQVAFDANTERVVAKRTGILHFLKRVVAFLFFSALDFFRAFHSNAPLVVPSEE
jgi:hypothetical protein